MQIIEADHYTILYCGQHNTACIQQKRDNDSNNEERECSADIFVSYIRVFQWIASRPIHTSIIPEHEEETSLWKRTRKISATATTTILFLDVTSFSSFRPLTEVKHCINNQFAFLLLLPIAEQKGCCGSNQIGSGGGCCRRFGVLGYHVDFRGLSTTLLRFCLELNDGDDDGKPLLANSQ